MSTTAIILLSIYTLGLLSVIIYALSKQIIKLDHIITLLILILWPLLILPWFIISIYDSLVENHRIKKHSNNKKTNWKL